MYSTGIKIPSVVQTDYCDVHKTRSSIKYANTGKCFCFLCWRDAHPHRQLTLEIVQAGFMPTHGQAELSRRKLQSGAART